MATLGMIAMAQRAFCACSDALAAPTFGVE